MSGPLTAVVNRDSESSVNSQKRITENCGVCGKPGVEVYWYSSMSRGAHTVCYGKIEEIQRDLIKKIDDLYEKEGARSMAFRDAIDAIREQLKGLSFTAFIDTYGSAELKSIFDSVGVKAAEDFLPNAGRYS